MRNCLFSIGNLAYQFKIILDIKGNIDWIHCSTFYLLTLFAFLHFLLFSQIILISLKAGPSNIFSTIQILRLLSSEAQGCKDFSSKPCHTGIHWIALAEYSQMSTHMPGFQSFFRVFRIHFILAKLAISSKRVKGFVKWL